MQFEELVNRQYSLVSDIKQFIENCKKAPRERRTSQFYASKIERLNKLAQELHLNNADILGLKEKPLDDTYFSEFFYDEINKLVVDYIKVLERAAVELSKDALAIGTKEGAINNPSNQGSDTVTNVRRLLRNQRALMQALTKNIDEIYSKRNEDHPQAYYTIKATILEKHMVDFAQTNAALWETTDEGQIEDYTLQTYYELEAKVEAALIELQQHMSAEAQPGPTSITRASDISTANVKLPRLSVPKFSGDYMHWMSFKDLFMELVHNSSISESQKMQYLSQSLSDEPKNLIRHLPATGSNYAAAWNILTSRYDNKRLLVSTLLSNLLSQPAIKDESPSTMKSLHDVTKECLHGLRAQGLPIQHWDSIIVHIILQKMDQPTQTAFDQGIDDCRRLITLDEILKFLERRFQSLEVRGNSKSTKRTCGSIINTIRRCSICKGDNHFAYECAVFKAAPINKKWKYVKDSKLCANCLRPGHLAAACKSRHCNQCTKRHNTLLHSEANRQPTQASSAQGNATTLSVASIKPSLEEKSESVTSLLVNSCKRVPSFVLLGTARIVVETIDGHKIECRAVLDSGSQVNLITERLQRKLGTHSSTTPLCIEGVGVKETTIRHQTTIMIKSKVSKFATQINAHIIPKIVSDQPSLSFNTNHWNIPSNVVLADPDFANPGQIDCLLGAAVFFDLLTKGIWKLGTNLPTLKNTVFGWVVAGNIEISKHSTAICGICTSAELDKVIAKFWKMEEIPEPITTMTDDDLRCETHFAQTVKRASDGRFIVKLPLRAHPSNLVDSRAIAYQRFKAIERRLEADPTLRSEYVKFMREYEQLGHMTQISAHEITKPYYFIPHHCVLRPESTSTKLRVVFDASATKPSQPSLNDMMYTGPTVQDELFSILLRFRMHRFVLKTDVEKMYRQIWIHDEHRNLQLIMWRESSIEQMKYFRLNTVTYGTRAAPYLATRCLKELALRNQGSHPYGAQSLLKDFYVDDGLIGANTIREALATQSQLIQILEEAGMKLRKWCANDVRLLHGIPQDDQEVDLSLESEGGASTKTLGILWLPKSDVFCIKVNVQEHERITKRTMTSDLAHIYDPLGLIAPVLVTGKIQIQQVWHTRLDWDEDLPSNITKQWTMYREDLSSLKDATFPRYVLGNDNCSNIQLHAFADASEKAYGAAVYVRSVDKNQTIRLNLLCSKSRVAPIKTQTIPRLELCAALLAAELMARVQLDLGYQGKESYFWTDSQIVLSWINNHPGKLPVFVAHRIVKILNSTIADQWRHVPSKQNPADILSRGLKPREFSRCNMWLYGPMFLYQPKSLWPAPVNREIPMEDNPTVVAITTEQAEEEHPWIYSIHSKNSFSHVQHVIGYVLRFIKNAKIHNDLRPEFKHLSPTELDAALKLIIHQIQISDFPDARKALTKNKFLPNSHSLSSLTPFIDEEGIIRVGGRLTSSTQPFDAIHQMLLPGNDPLVKLLVERIHNEHYHCGPQALVAQVRQRFWPLKVKSLARAVVQRCVRCTKAKPIIYRQIMGNLPAHRVQPARPFLNTGVDYCGPLWVHFKTRGKRPQKAYIAVFCCFSTKAVHMELVTDLTTDAFIGALKRFIARRGQCKTLYCDNATNFVGAKNQLQELNEVIYATPARESITGACSAKGIEFHFIPPRSPHFGGLWEAAVKSAKQLLVKNVSTASLTYEELETVIVEIEAILNSRPLIPSSSDANDFNAITPGHFLIGEPLTSCVDVNAPIQGTKLLDHWKRISEIKHSFWQRWSREYLTELQQRHKWKGPVSDIQPDTLVILKDDNLPVLKWPLGRIEKVYKGDDGFVRVCDVKTQRGTFKRAVHKLAPLFPEKTEYDEKKGTKTSLMISIPLSRIRNIPPAVTTTPSKKLELTKNNKTPNTSLLVSIPLNRIKNVPPAIDESPKKKQRLHTTMIYTIIALLMLPIAIGSPINLTTFENKPGVYFERLSNIKLITMNWNLVVYFDLEPLQQEMNILTDGTRTLQKLCDKPPHDSSCNFLLLYFEHTLSDLQTKLNLLSIRRSKRGAIDVVGNVANALFGVLDSNYATKMSETIDGLKQNDAHLETLLKNQTSLIDSTVNIIKTNQLSTQAKFNELDLRLSELFKSNKQLSEIQLSQHVISLSVQMFILASNLQWTYSSVMDVLIDSHHGKLNPMLLTPSQLSEEVFKIRAYLPPNLQLPIHQNNLLEAYRLIKVNGVIAKKHVVFTIELPLVDPREFELIHLSPIEAVINNSLSAARLSTEYLAISPHQDEFISMTQYQLDACLSFSVNELLCQNEATFNKASTVNKCERDLLNNQAHPRCEFYKLDDTTKWHRLTHPNHWIYATINTIELYAVCTNESIQLELKASGLIQLRSDCTLKTDAVTIKGHNQIVSALQSAPTKFTTMQLGWSKLYTPQNISMHSFKPSIHELELIQEKLAKIEDSALPDKFTTQHQHSLIVGYTAVGMIIVLCVAVLIKFKGQRKSLVPIAAPRLQSLVQDTPC